MKTINIYVVALMALAAFSCTREQNPVAPDGSKNVSLTIMTGKVTSRAVETPATDGYTVALTPASTTVYFLGTGGFTVATRLLSDGVLNAGTYTFSGLPESVTSLYVVCNEPATGITYANTSLLTNIKAGYGDFGTLTGDYTSLLMSNAAGTVSGGTTDNTSDAVALTLTTAATPTTNAIYSATVNVAPVVSRLELAQITGTGNITDFSVAGIYLDDYYPSFTVGAGAFGTQMSVGQLPANLASVIAPMKDLYSTPLISAANVVVPPTAGNNWAWQVPTGDPSRIILELTDVYVSGDLQPGTWYVTVKGYNDGMETVTDFVRAKVYRVSDLSFDETNLGLEPNATLNDIEATVVVLPWKVIEVVPNL